MFPDGIMFVCFDDAERVLSAIAKFLVHLLEEGEWWGEMREGERYREKGRMLRYSSVVVNRQAIVGG